MKILVLSPATEGARNVVRDFMYGCWCSGRRIGGMQMPPLNLLFVATVLKEDGHDVELVDAGIDYEAYRGVRERIDQFHAVVLLTSSNSFKLDIGSSRELKQRNPGLKVVMFGSHPTFMPEYCLAEESVDIVVRREPEFAMRDLFREMEGGGDWRAAKGIGYRNGRGIVLNDYYPFIRNMDELPIPDRTLLPQGIDYFNPVVKRMPYTTMQTSRGCPAKCNFCTVPTFFGRKIRVRSTELVVREFALMADLGYREVFIRDETFTAHRKRNEAICRGIIRTGVDMTWICNARADMIEERDIELMRLAGCHLIKFGVESGDQGILDNIRKGITIEQTRKVFAACRKMGVDTHAHVMLGCIGETRGTIEKTIEFVRKLEPTTASFGIFTPYPGTEVFERVAAVHPEITDGTGADMNTLHIKGFYNSAFCGLPQEDLERYVRKAYRSFYFRPSYLVRRALRVTSYDEAIRLAIAGSNILGFGAGRDN